MDEKERFYHEKEIAEINARAMKDLAAAIRYAAEILNRKMPNYRDAA